MKALRTGAGVLIAACVVLWLTHPGGAYSLLGQRWATASVITMHLQLGSPSGALLDESTSWNQVTERALELWNPFLGSVSFVAVRGVTTEGMAEDNDINNVFWAADVYGDSWGDAAAITISSYNVDENTWIETDVIFNSQLCWNSYRGPSLIPQIT